MSLSGDEKRVCGLIEKRRAALLDDLRLHVGIPTGGGYVPGLDETRERLVARLEKLGASTEIVPGQARPDWLYGVEPGAPALPTAVCRRSVGGRGHGLATTPGRGTGSSGGTRPVLISGHLDTVHDPKGAFRELTIAPDGKTALGPGVVDMKGGLVIALGALEALEEAGIRLDWTVVLNSDEETGSYCSERILRREAEAGAAAGGIGIVVEPALPGGGLVVERLGTGHFLIETRGRSAHVGRDFEKGVSAVTALAECLVRVARLPDPARGKIVCVGPIEGGHATNVVPDRARAWGNVRFPSAPMADEIGGELDALATPEGAMPGVTIRRSFARAAKPLTPATQRLAELARDTAGALGQAMTFGKTGGVCDGNILQGAGLPTLDSLGVRGGGLHTTDEWIEIPSLVERCQLLAVFMMRAAGGGTGGPQEGRGRGQ